MDRLVLLQALIGMLVLLADSGVAYVLVRSSLRGLVYVEEAAAEDRLRRFFADAVTSCVRRASRPRLRRTLTEAQPTGLPVPVRGRAEQRRQPGQADLNPGHT